MPSNFIEKYLDKSRRTKVVLSVPVSVPAASLVVVPINPAISYLSIHLPNLPSPNPRCDRTVLKRNIAFSSSRKQNPFLPLEHSLEIDSAYIGLLVGFADCRSSLSSSSRWRFSSVMVRMPAVTFLYGCLVRDVSRQSARVVDTDGAARRCTLCGNQNDCDE